MRTDECWWRERTPHRCIGVTDDGAIDSKGHSLRWLDKRGISEGGFRSGLSFRQVNHREPCGQLH